jgi:hypothetical protein
LYRKSKSENGKFFQKNHLMIMQCIVNETRIIFFVTAKFCNWICEAGCSDDADDDDDGPLQSLFTDKFTQSHKYSK